MDGLEIPERAKHQATEALLDYLDPTDVAATAANAVLQAAGPIIVANRLRQLADDYARRADQIDVRNAAGTFVRNAFLRCAELARADADELDPGGAT